MSRGDYMRALQQEKRDAMCERISEAIEDMRAEKRIITKAALAKELGISRQNLNKDYVKDFLQKFEEFSPNTDTAVTAQELDQALRENQQLRSKLVDEIKRRKAVELKLDAAKMSGKEREDRYRRLLGEYQKVAGDKIKHI